MATFGTGLMLGFRATIMSLARASESPSRQAADRRALGRAPSWENAWTADGRGVRFGHIVVSTRPPIPAGETVGGHAIVDAGLGAQQPHVALCREPKPPGGRLACPAHRRLGRAV